MTGRRSSTKRFEVWHTIVTMAALGVAMKVLGIAVTVLCYHAVPVPAGWLMVAVLVAAASLAGFVYLLRELLVQVLLFLRR